MMGPHYLGIVSAEPPAAEQHDGGRVRLLLAPNTGPHWPHTCPPSVHLRRQIRGRPGPAANFSNLNLRLADWVEGYWQGIFEA